MPVTLNEIFNEALKKKASDVHLLVGRRPMFRVDGALTESEFEPLSQRDLEAMLTKIITPEQRKRFQEEYDLDFSYTINTTRFRMNVSMERGNFAITARVIPSMVPSFQELMIPDAVGNLLQCCNGLILVTGPTGCGKSTTLSSIIERINSEKAMNIVTLEDPIEFVFSPKKSIFRQREYGTDMRSFAEGLKHGLRQDPNVIMVGEMRDPETIATTLTLAETGHLVLSTLHTPSAAQAVDRIIDVFPPHQQTQIRLQLALVLRAVMAQQLLPREGGGRVAARELLVNTTAIANLIRENKIAQIPSVMQTHAATSMMTFDMSLRDLLDKKLITDKTVENFKLSLGGVMLH